MHHFVGHQDYITSGVYGNGTQRLYTSAQDGFIFGRDMHKLDAAQDEKYNALPEYIAVSKRTLVSAISLGGQTINSIDLEAGNEHLLISASTDCIVRLFDVRQATSTSTRVTPSQIEWRGHKDNVRCVKFSACGKYVFSCASDRSIKKWDLRKRRCVATYYLHDDSVLKLHVGEGLPAGHLLSFGRDGRAFYLDSETKRYSLVLQRDEPLYCGALTDQAQHLWVGTDNGIYRYPFKRLVEESEMMSIQSPVSGSFSLSSPIHSPSTSKHVTSFGGRADTAPFDPLMSPESPPHHSSVMNRAMAHQNQATLPQSELHAPTPDISLEAQPRIIKHKTLNDRRSILTEDNHGNVALLDVTKGGFIHHYGTEEDFDTLLERINPQQSIPSWFSVSIKLGHPQITLTPHTAFAATTYIGDADLDFDLSTVDPKLKVNYGEILLRNAFSRWLDERIRINTEAKMRMEEKARKRAESENEKQERQNAAVANDVPPEDRMEDIEEEEAVVPPPSAPQLPNEAASADQSAAPATLQSSLPLQPMEDSASISSDSTFTSDLANQSILRKQYDETKIRFKIDEQNTQFTVHYDASSDQYDHLRPALTFTIATLDPQKIHEFSDIPEWVVDALMLGIQEQSSKLKLHLEPKDDKFVVKPYTKTHQQPLTGNRLTQIKDVCDHLAKHTQLPLKKGANNSSGGMFGRGSFFGSGSNSKDDEVPATEYFQIFAADDMANPLDVSMTLGVANQFHRNKSGPFTLYYGKNPRY